MFTERVWKPSDSLIEADVTEDIPFQVGHGGEDPAVDHVALEVR
jgi:hypothetical protein